MPWPTSYFFCVGAAVFPKQLMKLQSAVCKRELRATMQVSSKTECNADMLLICMLSSSSGRNDVGRGGEWASWRALSKLGKRRQPETSTTWLTTPIGCIIIIIIYVIFCFLGSLEDIRFNIAAIRRHTVLQVQGKLE